MNRFYLHFPFCETRCHYCDFYALAKDRTGEKDASSFVKALRQELTLRNSMTGDVHSIFMGGGTPSLTEPQDLEYIFSDFLAGRRFAPQYEWTSECNPSSITREKLRALKNLGLNRISLGVQTFEKTLLKALGRIHNPQDVFTAVEALHAEGITNFSIDLMCGIPGQTLKDLERSLEDGLRTGLKHLSCYILTLPKHHPMYKDLPDEKTQLAHYLFLSDFLKSKGFHHYEISNFARPGFEARHNLAYWKGESYLGLGPSAHSYDSGRKKRWKNVSSLKKYLSLIEQNQCPEEQVEHLNAQEVFLERWMLALRLSEGFPQAWLNTHEAQTRVERLMHQGLTETHPEQKNHIRLTAPGFALSDQIALELSQSARLD